MELPIEISVALQRRVEGYKLTDLQNVAQRISRSYNEGSLNGARVIINDVDALVYALSRMPATYGAIATALNYVRQMTNFNPQTALDIGAGTGAAALASGCESITCVEREPAMRKLGEELLKECGIDSVWIEDDLRYTQVPHAQLVISSYALNELERSELEAALLHLWELTEGILLITEPGTPSGYSVILRAREIIGGLGANIIAPCPDITTCPLEKDDWCHFTCRISRSKTHKALKGGDVPYEDEKFSYIAFSRFATTRAQARILRHPFIEKGVITLSLCTQRGVERVKVRKTESSKFKAARKSSCGDSIEID